MKISNAAIGWIMIIVCFTGVVASSIAIGVFIEHNRNASRMEARQEEGAAMYRAQVDSIEKMEAGQTAVISPSMDGYKKMYIGRGMYRWVPVSLYEAQAVTDTVVSKDPTLDDILDRLLILEKEIPSLKKHLLTDHAKLRAMHIDIKNSGILEEIEAIKADTTRARRTR